MSDDRSHDQHLLDFTDKHGDGVSFEIDSEGDIYVEIRDDSCRECSGRSRFFSKEQSRALRDWLNKVIP